MLVSRFSYASPTFLAEKYRIKNILNIVCELPTRMPTKNSVMWIEPEPSSSKLLKISSASSSLISIPTLRKPMMNSSKSNFLAPLSSRRRKDRPKLTKPEKNYRPHFFYSFFTHLKLLEPSTSAATFQRDSQRLQLKLESFSPQAHFHIDPRLWGVCVPFLKQELHFLINLVFNCTHDTMFYRLKYDSLCAHDQSNNCLNWTLCTPTIQTYWRINLVLQIIVEWKVRTLFSACCLNNNEKKMQFYEGNGKIKKKTQSC